ncbi:hypothetical protein BGZ95_004283 [Linnemannia exigua]|uniref:Tail specific protease domain-containing protein n=1 Tax=Linnemannia exigua TaxID=604196 RepID=A0AAD4H1T0_9FUNG|nr:hypothetical protein BGZ95_004283 [Linnemannia exigua]
MVSFTLHSAIFSALLAVAAITTFTAAAPVAFSNQTSSRLDACGRLGQKNGVDVKYKDVAACYRAIPFDRFAADTTISTVHDLFRDYYVFTDKALAPRLPKPFTSESVDILKQLQTIGLRKYKSDYQFHTDVRYAIDTLRDGHASYDVNCYTNYAFQQHLSLYAPVKKGVQTVRVFTDYKERGYEDCIVDKIDGQPALDHIRQWATKRVTCSHDVNTRLNCALSRQGYYAEDSAFIDEPGEFSVRAYLPDKRYIDYELRCSNKKSSSRPIRLREEWVVFPQSKIQFEDVESYVANVCLSQGGAAPSSAVHGQARPHLRKSAPLIKKRDLLHAYDTVETLVPVQKFDDAEKLVAGNATIFYRLKSQPDVGVMVVHTLDANFDEVDTILEGLTAFHSHNVTKVLVDLQGNGGGILSLSSDLTQMLFPNNNTLDASFEVDMRAPETVQRLSALGFNSPYGANYDARAYHDLQVEGAPQYENNDLFMKPVNITRNGRTNQYSERTVLYSTPLSTETLTAVAAFPWTGRRENIRILTDGRCASACGMTAYFWTKVYGIEAYSIGGTKGEDLSMFSFAGASVSTLSDLQDTYSLLKMESPLKEMAYKNQVRFAWLELYGKNRTVPLEYDAELYRPNHRLDYTQRNARSREVMWRQVAGASWK